MTDRRTPADESAGTGGTGGTGSTGSIGSTGGVDGHDSRDQDGTDDGGSPRRRRMAAHERREQLVAVGRAVFAERGIDGATVEEVAARAGVSKPVVYEHFGGKEGLYAVVVDRETTALLSAMTAELRQGGHPREMLERAALAFLDYVEDNTDGFRILVRDSPVGRSTGSFASLISDIARQVEHLLAAEFTQRGFDPRHAPLYSQMLVGMVALAGQWWLDVRTPPKAEVAAHMVNLTWNGLTGFDLVPRAVAHVEEVTRSRSGR